MSTLLEDFKGFLKDTHGLIMWALGAGLFGAIAAKFIGISPPWPSAGTSITCGALLLALMRVFLNHRGFNVSEARRRFGYSNYLLVFSSVLYLIGFSLLVESNTKGELLVTGFVCTKDAKAVYANCPFLSENEIAQSNYQVDQLWTKTSITAAEVSLFALWISSFCLFINSAGLFVLFSRGKKVRRV